MDAKPNTIISFAPLFDYNFSGMAAQKLVMNTTNPYLEPFSMKLMEVIEYAKEL